MPVYHCTECGKTFTLRNNLTRHMRTHTQVRLNCSVCTAVFVRPDNLHRHEQMHKRHGVTATMVSRASMGESSLMEVDTIISPSVGTPAVNVSNILPVDDNISVASTSHDVSSASSFNESSIVSRPFECKDLNTKEDTFPHHEPQLMEHLPSDPMLMEESIEVMDEQCGSGRDDPVIDHIEVDEQHVMSPEVVTNDNVGLVDEGSESSASEESDDDLANESSMSDSVEDISSVVAPDGFEEIETAFLGRLKTYRLRDEYTDVQLTIPEFMVNVFDRLIELLQRIMSKVTGIKTNIWLECEFTNIHGETCRRAFKTKNVVVLRTTDLEETCSVLFQKLLDEKESSALKGSGWTFAKIVEMEVRVNMYSPLRGSSYIPLPLDIASRKAVSNVVNDKDQKCFKYAILTRYVNNPNRLQLRATRFTPEVEARSKLDFSDLVYPVSIDQISKFERKNGVSVNLYGLDKVKSGAGSKARYNNIVFPLRIAKEQELHPDHYDLLYLTNEQTTHYALITNFSRLVRSQLTKCERMVFVCKRCFAHFDNQPNVLGQTGAQRFADHSRYCKEHSALRTDLAEKPHIQFEQHERTRRARFTLYADFECALVPVETDDGVRQVPPSTVSAPEWDLANQRPGMPHHHHKRADGSADSKKVTTRTVHKPYAYAYFIHDSKITADGGVDDGNGFSHLRMYTGEDAAKHFMASLRADIECIGDVLYAHRQNQPNLSVHEEAAFQAATECYLWNQPFEQKGDKSKVRDHLHSAPYQYRGAAHRNCNLRYKEQDVINCYFHNLSNYDAHFVVRELGLDTGDVSVLANTEEKFISFTKRFDYPDAGRHERIAVRFVDSYRFLSYSLAKLVSFLPEDKLRITKEFFPNRDQFDLVRRKGVFPYEYVTSVDVLSEESLPPPEAFDDRLSLESIKPEEYEHAQRVWSGFKCKTLGDYADVYLKTDVLLLTDVFEAFRDMCMEHYGLDPAHWITLPSYAWSVMLRKTGVVLDTLQYVDQYLFFEKGIRGGLTQCVTRNVVADNKFTRGEGSNASGRDDDTHIMYYDANNLYGWAMSQTLPRSGFKWMATDEIDDVRRRLETTGISEDSEIGYVLEVDLEYPRDHELHDRHRDLPFCPELRKAPIDQLPFTPDVLRNFSVGQNEKLMVSLTDKEHYVIHYRLLQQALENGLRIRHIHRGVSFNQSPWLAPYVKLNTELRQRAQNKFEVELFKLMVNAVYGMSLQNVRKHIDVRLTTNPDSYTKYVAKSNFSDRTWYREDLALVHMTKTRVVLDKPVYVGMSILDQSKWWMYRFHYQMLDRYNTNNDNRIRLLYTDTDSLIYKIQSRDVYQDMWDHKEDFDTSNYPSDHKCYDAQNAKVLGKFKDETGGQTIFEFIGLMSKLYCTTYGNEKDKTCPPPTKRAKGVNRGVVAHKLTVDDYRRCLFQHTIKNTVNDRFQSRYHNIYTISVTKRSLAPYDDKRFIEPDGVNTLPWGHYSIPEPAST